MVAIAQQQQQSRRFPLAGHKVLYPAVFASILLHVLIFSYNGTVINTSQSSRTLRVLLNKPRPARPWVINQDNSYMPVEKPVSRLAKVIPDEVSLQQPEPTIAAPVTRQLPHPQEPSTLNSGWGLYRHVISAIGKGAFTKTLSQRTLSQRTFSVDDLPMHADSGPDYQVRPSLLPVMVSQARVFETIDQQGFAMVKTSDGFGNVICMQERGDWSDWGISFKGAADKMRNPRLMYRLNKAQCGHLR